MAELKLLELGPEGLSLCCQLCRAAPAGDALLYLWHKFHCISVTPLHYLIYLVKVHQLIVKLSGDKDSILLRDVVTGLGHKHIGNLSHQVVLVHLHCSLYTFGAYDYLRPVNLLHLLPGKIVVETAVKEEGAIYSNGFEVDGICH